MENLNSTNTWVYNCGARDFDYQATWGNGGTLTIQRNYLRSIRFYVKGYNPIKGWIQSGTTIVNLPTPTSDPYTFHNVASVASFVKGEDPNQYFCQSYKIESTSVIYHGREIIDEEHFTTVEGYFREDDPNYNKIPACPEIECD